MAKKCCPTGTKFPEKRKLDSSFGLPRNVAISHTPRSGGAGGLLVSKVLAHTVALVRRDVIHKKEWEHRFLLLNYTTHTKLNALD